MYMYGLSRRSTRSIREQVQGIQTKTCHSVACGKLGNMCDCLKETVMAGYGRLLSYLQQESNYINRLVGQCSGHQTTNRHMCRLGQVSLGCTIQQSAVIHKWAGVHTFGSLLDSSKPTPPTISHVYPQRGFTCAPSVENIHKASMSIFNVFNSLIYKKTKRTRFSQLYLNQ